VTQVSASIDIDAPREKVYDLALDPARLHDWVTIHRRVNSHDDGAPREGYEMVQTLHLRGATFRVRWKLTEADRPGRATWEGRGPAHSYARTSYVLKAVDGGRTRFEYENEFKAPGGFLGAAASRMVIGGVPKREATRSLQRLKHLLEEAR
jgi:uncharacterized membrane protein